VATSKLSLWNNTFWSPLATIWQFKFAIGSTHIASSAYQKWPTKCSPCEQAVQLSNRPFHAYLKFENRLREFLS